MRRESEGGGEGGRGVEGEAPARRGKLVGDQERSWRAGVHWCKLGKSRGGGRPGPGASRLELPSFLSGATAVPAAL